MSWLNGLSREEITEMYLDTCTAYSSGKISEWEFRASLAKLGYNATDISDAEKQHRPSDEDNIP